MTRSYVLTLLALSMLAALAYAAYLENNTAGVEDEDGTEMSAKVPWPGVGWLTRIASPETSFEVDGVTYTSSYEALMYGDAASNPCRNFNAWINSIFFGPQIVGSVIDKIGVEAGHYFVCYLRNFIGGMLVYYGTALLFHYHCYIHPRSQEIFKDRVRPTSDTIWDQIKLAQASLFIYVGLPVVDEFLVEQGYTRMYYTVEEMGGWLWYAIYMVLYFSLVEIGIYWMHRTLHTNKLLYKYVHMKHHKYNRADTLTPWASIAFNPLDGMLQASPYVLLLPFVPCHYLSHVALIFFTAIWATYIHDAMDWNIDPIMGSKYHTVHHTHYIYNYGQVFNFCDRFWGTLRVPDCKTGVKPENRKLVPTARGGKKSD